MRISPTARVTLTLALGVGLGIILGNSSAAPDGFRAHLLAVLDPIGSSWVNAIRMTVIPLIVPLVVVAVASQADMKQVGRLVIRTFVVCFGLLLMLAVLTTLLAPALFTGLQLDPTSVAALQASAKVQVPPSEQLTFTYWLTSLFAANPIKAAADGAILPVVIFTLAYGFALTRVSAEVRESQLKFFRGVSTIMQVVARWILALAPIGVFALSLPLGVRLGGGVISAIGFYLLVGFGLILLMGVVLYALVVFVGRVKLRTFVEAALPAQAVALSSRSSLAALPAMIEGARDKLRLPDAVTGFVLPLGVSTFKFTAPVFWPVGALFIGKLYGVHLDVSQVAMIAGAGVLLNASTPPIPSGGLLIQAPLFASVHLPLEGLGILIAIDTIPDMLKTGINVTADMVVAVLVGRGEKRSPFTVHSSPGPG